MLSNSEFDVNNMLVFAFIGICIKLFFGQNNSADGSSGRASSTIAGYGVVALAVMVVTFISFSLVKGNKKSNSSTDLKGVFAGPSAFFQVLKEVLHKSFTSIVTLSLLAYLIVLNITYMKRINQGSVPTEYYAFSHATTVLIIFQVFALFKSIKDKVTKSRIQANNLGDNSIKDNSDRMEFVIYFIGVLNIVVTGITNVILEYYTADGW